MTRERILKLQEMAVEIVMNEARREKAINEIVAKHGLSYAALRELKKAA